MSPALPFEERRKNAPLHTFTSVTTEFVAFIFLSWDEVTWTMLR